MLKLDLKDKKILYELDKNSRQHNASIGSKVGLSKQVVGFRIQRLVEEGVISSFYTVIDVSKLGFTVYKNLFRLQNMTIEDEKKLVEYARNETDVVWAASSDGRYEFTSNIRATDVEHLDNIINKFNQKFGSFIYEGQIATIIRRQYFPRTYLVNEKREIVGNKISFGSVPKRIKINRLDWKILAILGKNARASSVEVSEKVGISPDSVTDHIKKMEKLGVIKQYSIVPNCEVYPYLQYKVLISMKNMSDSIEKKLISYCDSNPNIVFLIKALGQWDFEVNIEVETVARFREIIMDFKANFENDIRDYSSLQIYKVHKYNFCPSIPTGL
jgi:DNA-binding Lrp family transcriptional regulator